MRRMLVVAAVAVALVGAVPAGAARPTPPCRDTSRACVVSVASRYLDTLLTNDASELPLAPDVWRTQNGQLTADDAQEVRDSVESDVEHTVAEITDLRWFVEGEHAAAFYLLWADGTGAIGPQDEPGLPNEVRTPTLIVERFRVVGGLIHEIEAIHWIEPTPGRHPDTRPVRPGDGDVVAPQPRAAVVSAAARYVDALRTHDGSRVPLATDAWRHELGRSTGETGAEIRASLGQPQMGVIRGVDDVRWFVEGDTAVAFYVLRTDAVGSGEAGGPLTVPAYVAERFRVRAGEIDQIEAVFMVGSPGETPWPREDRVRR